MNRSPCRAGRVAARRFLPIAACLLFGATQAFAHAHLESAEPPVGGTVAMAPAAITLTVSEALEPRFGSIEVKDAAGKRVDDGKPHAEADNAKRFSVGVGRLAPGVYTVDWHVTSVDTHRTEGSFRFTVK